MNILRAITLDELPPEIIPTERAVITYGAPIWKEDVSNFWNTLKIHNQNLNDPTTQSHKRLLHFMNLHQIDVIFEKE
jgi:hypothetical protein